MGKFERKTRKRVQGGRAAFDGHPGKEIVRLKIEYPAEGEGYPVFHTTLDCNGGELMHGMSVLAAEFVKMMQAQQGEVDVGLELATFLAQVQLGAAGLVGEGTD